MPPVVSTAVLSVEQALRDIDVGRDLAGARAKLDAALADTSLPATTRDEATLALARALDGLNEKEAAIKLIEALVQKHVDDHPWGQEEKADELLQKLVTGKVSHAPTSDGPTSVSIDCVLSASNQSSVWCTTAAVPPIRASSIPTSRLGSRHMLAWWRRGIPGCATGLRSTSR
jgi:hypothetical protein